MTTRQFISKNFGVSGTKRTCSSVFADSDGNIYSYGYHYPLLFTVNGRTIRNTRGYSSTTDRHILWSRDVEAIDVVAPYHFRLSGDDVVDMTVLLKSQREYIADLQKQMDAKKRKDTQVYKWLEHKHTKAVVNLAKLTLI